MAFKVYGNVYAGKIGGGCLGIWQGKLVNSGLGLC